MNNTSPWWSRNREIMPADAAPGSFDLTAHLAQHNPRWSATEGPISYWSSGVPLGNGDFGALVYGPPENLTLLLGKNDLWLRNNDRSYLPGTRYADLLKMFRAGDRAAFEALLPTDPLWADHFRPSTAINGGFFRLSLAEGSATNKFNQELHLQDATWRASFEASGLDNMWATPPDFEMDAFASAPDEVLVLRIRRHRLPLRSLTWRLNREKHQLLPDATVGGEGSLAWLEQVMLKGDRYAIAVLQAGPTPHLTRAQRSVIGETSTDTEHEVTFYLAAASHRDSPDPRALACARVTQAAQRGWDALHDTHKKQWALQWDRAWVSCSDAKVERPWYISNYLCATTLRPGKVSPGLQGMWIKENFPPWCADFHGNVNIQALYMGLMGANRMEYFEPCVRLYHEMRPQCQKDARDYFGTEGARYPHAGGIEGHELCEENWLPLAVSIGPSSWIARLFWWAYRQTLDRDFLAQAGYPIIKDVALYYEGLLKLAGKGPDGRYRLEPSIYSEYYATTFDAWGTNSTYDIVCMRDTFQQAADAADALALDTDLSKHWRLLHSELPALPANEQDIWMIFPQHPKNVKVEAGSWCYPVFPGEIASAFHGSAVERKQAQATWAYARENCKSAWCAGCPTVAAARMGDAEWAFRYASGLSKNGLNDAVGGIMQAEHGTGMSLALNNMLLLGVEDQIVLFAGMPVTVDAAFHSLRAPGAILVSAEQRGSQVTHAAFQALHGGKVKVLNPFDPGPGKKVRLHVRNTTTNAVIATWEKSWRELVEWTAEPGVVYQLEREQGE
jgi:hypothetical protein